MVEISFGDRFTMRKSWVWGQCMERCGMSEYIFLNNNSIIFSKTYENTTFNYFLQIWRRNSIVTRCYTQATFTYIGQIQIHGLGWRWLQSSSGLVKLSRWICWLFTNTHWSCWIGTCGFLALPQRRCVENGKYLKRFRGKNWEITGLVDQNMRKSLLLPSDNRIK